MVGNLLIIIIGVVRLGARRGSWAGNVFLALGVCLVWLCLVLIIDCSFFFLTLTDVLDVSFVHVYSHCCLRKSWFDVFFVRYLTKLFVTSSWRNCVAKQSSDFFSNSHRLFL